MHRLNRDTEHSFTRPGNFVTGTDTDNHAEAGYLLLVTSYWLLIHLLVTDSVYWLLIHLLVTDSVYWLPIHLLVTDY